MQIVQSGKGCYDARMELGKILGIVLVVGIIGPAFWLGVQVLENKFWLFIRKRRDAKQASRPNS